MFKLDLEKADEPEIKLPTSVGSLKKQEISRKTSTFASLTMLKPLCGSQQTEKFFKWWECQTTLSVSRETCMQIKKQQLEQDIKQWTGSKLGKEYVKSLYCNPAYLTSIQSTSWDVLPAGLEETQAGIKTERRNINNLRYSDDTTLMAKKRRTEEPLDESEEEWRSWLKTPHSEN